MLLWAVHHHAELEASGYGIATYVDSDCDDARLLPSGSKMTWSQFRERGNWLRSDIDKESALAMDPLSFK